VYNLQNESDLYGLVQVMIIIFGEQPPVYSIAGQRQENSNPSYPIQSPYPPYPTSTTGYPAPYPTVQPYPSGTSTATPYPPYPTTGYPPYPSTGGTSSTAAPYPSYPVSTTTTSSTGTISEDHIRASLLSAVEDKVFFLILNLLFSHLK
jgi:ESCRT-I complex subunit TSG101